MAGLVTWWSGGSSEGLWAGYALLDAVLAVALYRVSSYFLHRQILRLVALTGNRHDLIFQPSAVLRRSAKPFVLE
jgi:hypothetical protein